MGETDGIISKVNKRYIGEDGKPSPVWENELNYETTVENLQPIYFWIIDFASAMFKNLEKIKDNFITSPGSGYFSDLGARATKMQEESMKILGYVNTVVKSIINLIYDLKEFELLMKDYENSKSADPQKKQTGILGLKQRWMSSVDAKRGMGSIDNMAHQYGFTLLRPAFMAAESVEKVDGMDLNDIIKRILKPRLSEFFEWAKLSESELKKRYNIEKSYLKNQISTLNLYTSWVKPYLAAAEQLRMKGSESPGIVSVFSTMILELELLGYSPMKVEERVVAKDLPQKFKKIKFSRNYNSVGVINFAFRTFPSQQTMHAGKVTVSFKAFTMNDDEFLLFRYKKKEKDLKDMFSVTAITQETLDTLKDDIEKYTKEEEKKEEKEKGAFSGIFSSFADTFGITKKKEKKKEKTPEEKEKEESEKGKTFDEQGIPPDSYEESVLRDLAEADAGGACFKVFDTFKKSRGMASFVSPFDEPDVMTRLRIKMAEAQALRKAKEAKEASEAKK